MAAASIGVQKRSLYFAAFLLQHLHNFSNKSPTPPHLKLLAAVSKTDGKPLVGVQKLNLPRENKCKRLTIETKAGK